MKLEELNLEGAYNGNRYRYAAIKNKWADSIIVVFEYSEAFDETQLYYIAEGIFKDKTFVVGDSDVRMVLFSMREYFIEFKTDGLTSFEFYVLQLLIATRQKSVYVKDSGQGKFYKAEIEDDDLLAAPKPVGYLVRVNNMDEYFKLKSCICQCFGGQSLWLKQYKSHLSERELFEKFNIKYAFVSKDLTAITVAGNDDVNPLGGLFGEVELLTCGIVPFYDMFKYLKFKYKTTKRRSEFSNKSGWFNCLCKDEEERDRLIWLFEYLCFDISVPDNTIERLLLNINAITREVIVGAWHHILDFSEYDELRPRGTTLEADELEKQFLKAYNVPEEYYDEHKYDKPRHNVKSAHIVDYPAERQDEIKSRLEKAGFSISRIPSYRVRHDILYVDLFNKKASVGTHRYRKEKYEITVDQLFELLDNM